MRYHPRQYLSCCFGECCSSGCSGGGSSGGVISKITGLIGCTAGSQDQEQNAQLGEEIGGAVQAVVPIPGIGLVFAFVGKEIGGLFGPGTHRTPGGETYDASTYELHAGYFDMLALINEVRAQMGLAPVNPIGFVGLGTPGCNSQPDSSCGPCPQCAAMNCGAVNAPITGPYLAALLDDSTYAAATSETAMTNLQKIGAFDAGIQAQALISSHLQFILESLQVGTIVVVNGALAMPGAVGPTTANAYSTVQSQANAIANSPLYGGVQSSYLLAGLGVLGLIVLLKKRAA